MPPIAAQQAICAENAKCGWRGGICAVLPKKCFVFCVCCGLTKTCISHASATVERYRMHGLGAFVSVGMRAIERH